MSKNYFKRYSVFINGLLYRAFDSEEEAREFLAARWWVGEISSIYDNEKQDYVITEVRV